MKEIVHWKNGKKTIMQLMNIQSQKQAVILCQIRLFPKHVRDANIHLHAASFPISPFPAAFSEDHLYHPKQRSKI